MRSGSSSKGHNLPLEDVSILLERRHVVVDQHEQVQLILMFEHIDLNFLIVFLDVLDILYQLDLTILEHQTIVFLQH